nr:6-phosphogluconolactonase [Propionicimonas sp.]
MTTAPRIVATAEEVGVRVARMIADGLLQAASAQRPFLLGCPTGRTPEPVFPALAALAADGLDLGRMVIVLMDEYVVPAGGGFAMVDPEKLYSCVGYARRQILQPLAEASGTSPQLWHADPHDPGEYDRRIAAAGGIDVFLLASGASDGHVAFNPPGSARDSVTRVIELGESTRRDNMSTFPVFADLSEVPRHGLSVGVSTIADHTRRAVMMLTGADKRTAFERICAATAYEPDWPATIVAECADHIVLADAAAAGR